VSAKERQETANEGALVVYPRRVCVVLRHALNCGEEKIL
jgi:hypothetical protein